MFDEKKIVDRVTKTEGFYGAMEPLIGDMHLQEVSDKKELIYAFCEGESLHMGTIAKKLTHVDVNFSTRYPWVNTNEAWNIDLRLYGSNIEGEIGIGNSLAFVRRNQILYYNNDTVNNFVRVCNKQFDIKTAEKLGVMSDEVIEIKDGVEGLRQITEWTQNTKNNLFGDNKAKVYKLFG